MKRVALIGVAVALLAVASASASPAFTKGKARQAAAAKLTQFERNHGWVKSQGLKRCAKGARAVRCLGIARSDRKTCRLRFVILRGSPRRARIKRIACSSRPAAAPGQERIRLRAHLSSAPKRDLQNPFRVTFDYSASATRQVAAAGEEPTEPPPGVLALYSDGILECATNVGGGFADGECPVTYKALGEHRVTSIYTSGDESATVTEMQVIEPLPTTTELSVAYEPLTPSQTINFIDWRLGYLLVDSDISPPSGPLGFQCREDDGPNCLSDFELSGSIAVEGRQCGASDSRNAEPICLARVAGSSTWRPVEDFENGVPFLRVTQSPLAGGYIASEAIDHLQFSPTVVFPACDAEHGGPWCP